MTAAGLILAAAALAAQTDPMATDPGPMDGGAVESPEDTAGVPVRKRHAVFPLPVVFYTPETRWAGGAAAFHSYRARAEGRPTVSSGSIVYTQNHQVAVALNTDAYLTDGLYGVSLEVAHDRFPDRFYGIGNATLEADEETYTARRTRLGVDVRRRVAPGIYVGGSYEIRSTDILDMEEGGRLASGTMPGAGGGLVSGLGLSLTRDTRDNVLQPTTGSYHVASAVRFGRPFGGDFDLVRYTLDLRRYVTLRDGHVIGVHGFGRTTTGDVPFDLLPQLGGHRIMRGTFQGRYRDRHLVAAQAEYRLHVWRRIGLVAFAGAGQVADRLDALALADLHYSLGYGLRFMLDTRERMNLRLDFGYGRDGAAGTYITAGEAF